MIHTKNPASKAVLASLTCQLQLTTYDKSEMPRKHQIPKRFEDETCLRFPISKCHRTSIACTETGTVGSGAQFGLLLKLRKVQSITFLNCFGHNEFCSGRAPIGNPVCILPLTLATLTKPAVNKLFAARIRRSSRVQARALLKLLSLAVPKHALHKCRSVTKPLPSRQSLRWFKESSQSTASATPRLLALLHTDYNSSICLTRIVQKLTGRPVQIVPEACQPRASLFP